MFNFFKRTKAQYKPIVCILINNETEEPSLELHVDLAYAQDPYIKTMSQRIADHIKDNYLH